jgi:hypothetical protein
MPIDPEDLAKIYVTLIDGSRNLPCDVPIHFIEIRLGVIALRPEIIVKIKQGRGELNTVLDRQIRVTHIG